MKKRFTLGNIDIDNLSQTEALKAIELLHSSGGGKVFTPNVDHVMLAETNPRFRDAYRNASLCLPDGMPIVWASKILKGKSIPGRVAGSDLLLPLLQLCYGRNLSVYFLGSTLNTLDAGTAAAAKNIYGFNSEFNNMIGGSSPTISEGVSDFEVEEIMRPISQVAPDIIIVLLGAPKQEIFIEKAHKLYPKAVYLGLGASLDFLAGTSKRAPKFLQRLSLEWLYRLVQEPKRLLPRYLRDMQFPLIVLRELFRR